MRLLNNYDSYMDNIKTTQRDSLLRTNYICFQNMNIESRFPLILK